MGKRSEKKKNPATLAPDPTIFSEIHFHRLHFQSCSDIIASSIMTRVTLQSYTGDYQLWYIHLSALELSTHAHQRIKNLHIICLFD